MGRSYDAPAVTDQTLVEGSGKASKKNTLSSPKETKVVRKPERVVRRKKNEK